MMRQFLCPGVFLQVSQEPHTEDLAVEDFLGEDAFQGIDINTYEVFQPIQTEISDGDFFHLFGHE